MGSAADSIVLYGSRSPSRSKKSGRSRSRRRSGRSRSRSKSGGLAQLSTLRNRKIHEEVEQKRFAKEQAKTIAKAAASRVEAAQKALDTAIQESAKCQAAELEAEHALQEAMTKLTKVDQESSIQKLIDERQDARKAKDFDKSDRLREELRSMGVQVNDDECSWTGPDGMSGEVQGGSKRRPGDWDCPSCGMMCFASKDRCFKCGTRKSGEKGGGGGDRGGRRSPSYSRKGRDRGRDKRRRRRDDSEDESSSESPSRRRRRR
mmetsp:Transcript_130854/g.240680  ORF Transcript_130854/g.240680 Transcript_130854/m.240680 type:complete len:262 (+) Transcript_130854:128-913(+)